MNTLIPFLRSALIAAGVTFEHLRQTGGEFVLVFADGSTRNATPAEIAAAQAAYDAAEAQRIADKADRQELRDSFAQWRDTLQGVRDEAAWTNAKRDAALKDMARIQLKMLKILRDIALP
jgi:hypothetical protein